MSQLQPSRCDTPSIPPPLPPHHHQQGHNHHTTPSLSTIHSFSHGRASTCASHCAPSTSSNTRSATSTPSLSTNPNRLPASPPNPQVDTAPRNPLRSNPHTSIALLKSLRTSEWAAALEAGAPADSSVGADVGEEARERSRWSETIVRLTTTPGGLDRVDSDVSEAPQCDERPWSGEGEGEGERLWTGESKRRLVVEGVGGSLGEGKSRIRMLTDEERMRKEIEELEVPSERVGAKRPGGWRWWFGID